MRKALLSAIALCALTLFAAPANAAYILWDDNDLGQITVTAGDFEFGFSVNGSQLTIGLGNSGSITLVDADGQFSGSWFDLGQSVAGHTDVLFGLPSDPTAVTSGVEYTLATDGRVGTITGTFGGFNGIPYFGAGSTFAQDGHVELFNAPFLSMSFDSEAVPEPATLLMAVPAVGFFIRRRLRRR